MIIGGYKYCNFCSLRIGTGQKHQTLPVPGNPDAFEHYHDEPGLRCLDKAYDREVHNASQQMLHARFARRNA